LANFNQVLTTTQGLSWL